MPSEDTLYERLDGHDAIDAVVEEFYNRVLADEDLTPYFEDIDTDALRAHQKDFLTYATGGRDDYTGVSMYEAHAQLAITDEAFD